MNMKTSPHSLISLLFILFSIYTNSPPCAAAQEPEPVVDMEGNELRVGVQYYMVPFIWPGGGGLTLGSAGNQTCPLSVIQLPWDTDKGFPVTFHPVNSDEGVIRVSTNLNIKFEDITPFCPESTVWKVDSYDESTGKSFIIAGGAEGNNQGSESTSSWFKIEKIGWYYRLAFCPYADLMCKVIGRFPQDGQIRFALTDFADPFVYGVLFSKKSDRRLSH